MATAVGLRRLRFICFGTMVALLTPTLSSCIHHHHHPPASARVKKQGPPPWAPAHGYRHKHSQGVELVFDSGIGVYLVVGHEHHYFHGDRFYRRSDSGWVASTRIRGPWVSVELSALPAGLAGRASEKHRGHGGGPPAKHGKGHGSKW